MLRRSSKTQRNPTGPLPLCIAVSLPLCIAASLPLCLSASLYLCISASLYLCISASLYLCLSASLYLCLSVSLPREVRASGVLQIYPNPQATPNARIGLVKEL